MKIILVTIYLLAISVVSSSAQEPLYAAAPTKDFLLGKTHFAEDTNFVLIGSGYTTLLPPNNYIQKQTYRAFLKMREAALADGIELYVTSASRNAHIERKKSKCDYLLQAEPTQEQVAAIEAAVNEVIGKNLPVTVEYMTQAQAAEIVDLSKLPANATDTLRIVRVGDYDACACAGDHVQNTSEIAPFKIISADFTPAEQEGEPGRWRMRFKLLEG